ncbi:MAG TPA: ribosomal L7Ae/L30e/S12e/Gadd45 family protein [Geobacteraceae bacterium]|nr:ribosomal L7Ae/L30e/S12e/Gadd45 family protein [Geobacteraceae bacterium]
MEERIASYLALANKAGKVVSGSDLVAEALKRNSPVKKLVLVATDVSEDIGNRIRGLAEQRCVQHETFFSKEHFGDLLGKGLRSVAMVQGDGFVNTMNKEIARYRNFLRGEGCADE